MVTPDLAESMELSRQYVTDHSTYSPFTLTSDKKTIFDCIDSRDANGVPHGEYKVTVQTPGGGAGEGLDAAIGMSIVEGRMITIEEGMESDKANRPMLVSGVHHDCKFINFLAEVTAEMSDPSDFTKDTIEKYARYFNERELVDRALGSVMMAASRTSEYLQDKKHVDSIVNRADELYPHHSNVKHVRGPGLSSIYVTNFHPLVGKNRNMKPRDPAEAIKIQAHHDSLGATVNILRGENHLDAETRGNRLVSMLARSAATRTVVVSGWDEVNLFDVKPTVDTKSGLTVKEEKLA